MLAGPFALVKPADQVWQQLYYGHRLLLAGHKLGPCPDPIYLVPYYLYTSINQKCLTVGLGLFHGSGREIELERYPYRAGKMESLI